MPNNFGTIGLNQATLDSHAAKWHFLVRSGSGYSVLRSIFDRQTLPTSADSYEFAGIDVFVPTGEMVNAAYDVMEHENSTFCSTPECRAGGSWPSAICETYRTKADR